MIAERGLGRVMIFTTRPLFRLRSAGAIAPFSIPLRFTNCTTKTGYQFHKSLQEDNI